jgi:preprotein translocase subunit SecE
MSTKDQETKKPTEKKENKKAKEGGFLAYMRGVRQEMSKVVWPDRDKLISDTVAVFIVVAFFAIGFWAIDSGFLALLRQILGITLS